MTSLTYLAGSLVTRAPTGATMLGFHSGQPIMGEMPFGYRRVFLVAETNGMRGAPQPLTSNLLAFMLNGAATVQASSVDVSSNWRLCHLVSIYSSAMSGSRRRRGVGIATSRRSCEAGRSISCS